MRNGNIITAVVELADNCSGGVIIDNRVVDPDMGTVDAVDHTGNDYSGSMVAMISINGAIDNVEITPGVRIKCRAPRHAVIVGHQTVDNRNR